MTRNGNGKSEYKGIDLGDSLDSFPEEYRQSLKLTLRMYSGIDHHILNILSLAYDTNKLSRVNEQLVKLHGVLGVEKMTIDTRRRSRALNDALDGLHRMHFL